MSGQNKLDLSQPIFLQFNGKKFWEISLMNGNKTQIRYGKLVQGVEVESTVKQVEKNHKDYDECRGYITRVIETKKLKGYQGSAIQQVQKPPAASQESKNQQPFVIKINNAEEKEEEKAGKKEDDEDDKPTDPTKQCYLQLNMSWKAKFIVLTLNKKAVQEISGQIGLGQTWKSQSTELFNEVNASKYFQEQIEDYEGQGFVRNDAQYHSTVKEFEDSQNSLQAGSLGLPASSRNQRKPSIQLQDDSHSNMSNNSDKSDRTDMSQNSALDLSFDGINSPNSSFNNGNGEGPNSAALGKPGKLNGGVLLAEQIPDDMDPSGWYGSEKMDGVRAIWTGSTFYSRNGNEFYPPKFFIKNFPKVCLDGELFTKRDDFQRCVGIVKTQNKKNDPSLDDRWKEVTYLVYDAPTMQKPFKTRIETLLKEIPKTNSQYIKVLPHIIIQDREHLDSQLEKTLTKGGEGIMLRDPNSQYEQRRSKTLLKVKVFIDDEAVVTGVDRGEGRCADMMGAIHCRMKNGTDFKIGSGFNDQQRRRPPKIGQTVTFKYQNLSKNGKPRFPIFLRIKEGKDF